MEKLKDHGDLVFEGDERYDSMGHSAPYLVHHILLHFSIYYSLHVGSD